MYPNRLFKPCSFLIPPVSSIPALISLFKESPWNQISPLRSGMIPACFRTHPRAPLPGPALRTCQRSRMLPETHGRLVHLNKDSLRAGSSSKGIPEWEISTFSKQIFEFMPSLRSLLKRVNREAARLLVKHSGAEILRKRARTQHFSRDRPGIESGSGRINLIYFHCQDRPTVSSEIFKQWYMLLYVLNQPALWILLFKVVAVTREMNRQHAKRLSTPMKLWKWCNWVSLQMSGSQSYIYRESLFAKNHVFLLCYHVFIVFYCVS